MVHILNDIIAGRPVRTHQQYVADRRRFQTHQAAGRAGVVAQQLIEHPILSEIEPLKLVELFRFMESAIYEDLVKHID